MSKLAFYTEAQWHRALATIPGGFQIIFKEYHPKRFGTLRSISCNVIETFDHYLPGTTISESAPVRVYWSHEGKCYKSTKNRCAKFDLTETLKAIAEEDARQSTNS